MIFVHLNNSYTGSVKVLSELIDEFSKKNKTTLITSFNSEGFLKIKDCISCINVKYKSDKSSVIKAFSFFKFQIIAFSYIIRMDKERIVYINTIEPFLLGILCKLLGYQVICHLHESSRSNNFYSQLMYNSMFFYSKKIICVSNYLYNNIPAKHKNKSIVIYNTIRDHKNVYNKTIIQKKVLMISSLKAYKGVYHFCDLAKIMEDYEFCLIVSSNQKAINKKFKEYLSLLNLQILPSTKSVDFYYKTSDLILNLSDPFLIAETFGLTILEAKYFGLPAIVPEIGGITELIKDGIDGFKISVHNKSKLVSSIKYLLGDEKIYKEFSNNAIASISEFNFNKEYKKWKLAIQEKK